MTTILLGIFVFLIAAIGAAVGSFLNVVIWRVPEKMSLTSPPSHCPKCGAPVRWFDNIPIFSWFILRGKCRDCKEPISFRYPLVEFFSCLVAVVLGGSILFGNWTGTSTQVMNWEEYANWRTAWENAIASSSELEATQDPNSSSNIFEHTFSSDEFIRLLRSSTGLAIFWILVVDLTLMLGYIEWDRGFSPVSIICSVFITLFLVVGFVLLICDSDQWTARLSTAFFSVILGILGTCWEWFRGKKIGLDLCALGAVWGVAAGYVFALPGALVLSVLSFGLERRIKRQVAGLTFFAALVLFLFVSVMLR